MSVWFISSLLKEQCPLRNTVLVISLLHKDFTTFAAKQELHFTWLHLRPLSSWVNMAKPCPGLCLPQHAHFSGPTKDKPHKADVTEGTLYLWKPYMPSTFGFTFPHTATVPEILYVLTLTVGPSFPGSSYSVLKRHNMIIYHYSLVFDIKWNIVLTCGQNILKSRHYSAVIFLATIMKLNLYPNIKSLTPTTHILFMYLFNKCLYPLTYQTWNICPMN